MIWHPKPGLRVQLCYRKSLRGHAPHGSTGAVVTVGRGPGPVNVLVRLDDERLVIVPRGNLRSSDDRRHLSHLRH